ncbi:MAG: murein hydrolase activator EnvC family protein, partial [Spirochaetota bacterium]
DQDSGEDPGEDSEELTDSSGDRSSGQDDDEREDDSSSAGGEHSTLVWPHDGQRSERGGRVPGVRIDAAVGDQVRAVASGTVTFVGPYAGFGEVVIVESPTGYVYVYGGNDELHVEAGETVDRGTVLGEVGSVGSSSEVHFSVWHDDNPVDPENAPRS